MTPQDIDKILERADKLLEEAKAAYEEARSKSSVPAFVDAGFKLEEARIKYIVLQEIGAPDKQKIAADRLRAVNQLSKLIHDGRVAISGAFTNPPAAGPADPAAAPPAPDPSAAPAPAPTKAPVDVTKRYPIPDSTAQRNAEKVIRDLNKELYAQKAPSDRRALARLLLNQAARIQDDPAGLWVAYREALDQAVQGCEVEAITEAIEGTARVFDVDALLMKNTALTAAGKTARTPEDLAALTAALQGLIDELLRADQYDLADKAAVTAVGYSKKGADPALAARAAARAKEVSEAKALYQPMKGVLEKLARNPDDAGANMEMGKFLCYVKGSWDVGVRFLVKGTEGPLKTLAEKEAAAPAQAEDREAIADGWLDLAEKEKSAFRKARMAAHARTIYEAALPGATGLVRVRIEKRLGELARADEPSTAGLVGRWICNEGAGTALADSSGKGNRGTLQGGIKWAAAPGGSALSFEGGHVTAGVIGMPAPNAPMTIAWVHRISEAPAGNQIMVGMDDFSSSSSIASGFTGGQLAIWKWMGEVLVATAMPSVGEWHSCAYTFDGKTHRLYVDGTLKNSSTATPQSGPPPKRLEFGRWGGGGVPPCYYFSGLLRDVRIYTRPLTEGEIRAISRLPK